ncbi:MAG: lipopolysaccharide biosynthesis protein [Candidatus Manganitrophus sp. SA1]|nr:lipopolysaccharide biosynthesis protein [Candidatus Manganitrophus morganii]
MNHASKPKANSSNGIKFLETINIQINKLRLARFQTSLFIRDLFETAVVSVVTIFCLIMVTKLLAEGLGAERFGAYVLSRRVLSMIDPLVTLAMGVAVTRCIAMSRDEGTQTTYLGAGLLLGVLPAFLVLVVGWSLATPFAQLLFRDGIKYHALFIATLCLIVGYSFYVILYAYYRGIGKMWQANLWQASVIAIGPLVIAWLFARSGSVELIVFLMAGLLLCSMVPLVKLMLQARVFREKRAIFLIKIKDLGRYGLPRVPGSFAFGGLLAVGPLLAPYIGSLRDAGYLVASQSILRVVEGGTEAFGRAAFPWVTQVFSKGGKEALKDRVADLMSFILYVGLYGTIHLLIWSKPLTLTWLGREYIDAVLPVRVTLIALLPYLAFVTLRTIVDAVEVRAITTVSLFISLGVTVVVSLILSWSGLGSIGLAMGTTVGLIVLGSLVSAYVWKEFAIDRDDIFIWRCVITNAVFAVIGLILTFWLNRFYQGGALLGAGFIMEGSLFCFYLVSLRYLGVRWVMVLKRKMIGN